MMWVHNVRTDARTVGLGGEGRRVVKNGLKIFSYFGGDCPAVVVCCGRGFSSASMREIISMPAPISIPAMPASTLMRETTSMPAQYLAPPPRAHFRAGSRPTAPRASAPLFSSVCRRPSTPPYLPRKRPFLSVFSPVAAAFGCLSDPVLFFLGIFAY